MSSFGHSQRARVNINPDTVRHRIDTHESERINAANEQKALDNKMKKRIFAGRRVT